jgi:hypothetical protein
MRGLVVRFDNGYHGLKVTSHSNVREIGVERDGRHYPCRSMQHNVAWRMARSSLQYFGAVPSRAERKSADIILGRGGRGISIDVW